MKARIVRMTVTPLLRITDDDDNDLCLVDGNPIVLYSGHLIPLSELRDKLIDALTPEQMNKLVTEANAHS